MNVGFSQNGFSANKIPSFQIPSFVTPTKTFLVLSFPVSCVNPRTTDANLDCVFVEILLLVVPKIGRARAPLGSPWPVVTNLTQFLGGANEHTWFRLQRGGLPPTGQDGGQGRSAGTTAATEKTPAQKEKQGREEQVLDAAGFSLPQ